MRVNVDGRVVRVTGYEPVIGPSMTKTGTKFTLDKEAPIIVLAPLDEIWLKAFLGANDALFKVDIR